MTAFLLFIGIIQALAVLLPADFVAGLVHWAEDAYTGGSPVARPNITHPYFPRHFTGLGWWRSSRTECLVSAALIPAAWLMDHLPKDAPLFTNARTERPGIGSNP